MGNVITKTNLTLNTDTQLGKFIHEWALNDYTIHPDATATQPKKFKHILKKRACCTYTPSIGIGIAGVETKRTMNGVTLDMTPTKINQYKVNILPFNGADGLPSASGSVINEDNCKIEDDAGPGQSFYDKLQRRRSCLCFGLRE